MASAIISIDIRRPATRMVLGQGLDLTLFNAPQPRSRLYTNGAAYRKGALAALLGLGYETNDTLLLERELSGRHSGHAAIATSMARVAIYLVLKNLIQRGQKVILSPYTISDVVNMVLCAGGVPLFADIEAGSSCNIDADAVLDLLKTHDDVGAVLVTHFYGLICNIRPILVACWERGIPVVEDAAQAFGATLDGSLAGTIGEVGIFSFGLLKNITGFVGGAVITKNRDLEAKISRRSKRDVDLPAFDVFQKNGKGGCFRFCDIATHFWLYRLLDFPRCIGSQY